MPKIKDNNQIGIIVLFLYPIPNSRILPLVLYKHKGLYICIIPKIIINNNDK